MKKIEIEIEDEVYEGLETYCKETGFTKQSLMSVMANYVSKKQELPFTVGVSSAVPNRGEGFEFLKQVEDSLIIMRLNEQQPFIIAYILSSIDESEASYLFSCLSEENKLTVAQIIADGVCDDISLEKGIADYFYGVLYGKASCIYTDGINILTYIVNHMRPAERRKFISELPDELCEEVKKRIFEFTDIVILDDRAIQKVLREIDSQELAKALKNVDKETADKIFRNMSKRASAMLREDIEFMGPVRLIDIDEAQEKIVSVIRHLEDNGEIVIARNYGEELVSSPDWIEDYNNPEAETYEHSDIDMDYAQDLNDSEKSE